MTTSINIPVFWVKYIFNGVEYELECLSARLEEIRNCKGAVITHAEIIGTRVKYIG